MYAIVKVMATNVVRVIQPMILHVQSVLNVGIANGSIGVHQRKSAQLIVEMVYNLGRGLVRSPENIKRILMVVSKVPVVDVKT